jgi:uncharacterized protein (TIGR03083 family)
VAVQLQPVYGDQPLLVVDLPPTGAVHPVVAQRRRLAAELAELDEAGWHHPSRCEGWTSQDVITHLTSTNQFWAFSIPAGLNGEPSRFLSTFDPVASPAQLVADAGEVPVEQTLATFTETSEALVSLVEGLSEADLAALAEAPPGHLPIARVCDHAVWDSWVHERDIFLPLGRPTPVEDDEVRVGLRYAAMLGLGFGVSQGLPAAGSVAVVATGPDEAFVVSAEDEHVRVHAGPAVADDRVLQGDAVTLLEQLSLRDTGTPVPPEVTWMTKGLVEVFDQSADV